MTLDEMAKFFVVDGDGYLSFEYFDDSNDGERGDHVHFIEAGDSLSEILSKAEAFLAKKHR